MGKVGVAIVALKQLFPDCPQRGLYGQLTVNAGELLSDFMMAKNSANHPFTDSRVYGLSVSVFTPVGVYAGSGATGIKATSAPGSRCRRAGDSQRGVWVGGYHPSCLLKSRMGGATPAQQTAF